MTKKDLSGILREGMQNIESATTPRDTPIKPRNRRSTTPQTDSSEVPQEVVNLNVELLKEQERVKYLQEALQEQQELVKTLGQQLEEEQDKVGKLQAEVTQQKEKKQFIVPVGMGNHLVITPATSTVLTNEEIGWFD